MDACPRRNAGQIIGGKLEARRLAHRTTKAEALAAGGALAEDTPFYCLMLKALLNPWDEAGDSAAQPKAAAGQKKAARGGKRRSEEGSRRRTCAADAQRVGRQRGWPLGGGGVAAA